MMGRPQEVVRLEHQITRGIPLICDSCQNAVIGPRFECVNCSSYNICLTCELTLLETRGQAQSNQRRGPLLKAVNSRASQDHPIDHIFKIHLELEK